MKLMSFAEINDLENGQQVSSFQGTIKKVFDQKTDVGQYGQWWLQNIILQDEHANELTVTWTCEDAWGPKDEGKQFLFESGFDKKDQIVGLKREIKKKRTKVYESVKVDDRARVKKLNGEARTLADAPSGSSAPHVQPDPDWPDGTGITVSNIGGNPDPDWPEAHSHPGFHVEAPVNAPGSSVPRFSDDHGVQEAREHLMKCCNLYNLCIKAAVASICPNIPVEQRTSDQFQSTLASLWIEASGRRSTDGVTWWSYIDKMPQKPL